MVHVPKDQADDVDMEEDDEDNEEAQFLPSLQVIDRPQEQSTEKEGGSSLQREEPSQGRADPEFKGTVESLSRENKHIIWKQKMMIWLNVLSSGLACTTKLFRRRSWRELSRKRQKKKKRKKSKLKKNNKNQRSLQFHLQLW